METSGLIRLHVAIIPHYTLSELTAMYHEAGLKNITSHPIPMSPHTIVMGRS